MRARSFVRAALASAFAVALLVVALPAESFVEGLTAGGWTTTAKVSSSAPRPGDTVTITAAVTSNKNRKALVSVEVFSPTAEDIAKARRVIDADAAARAQGQGAFRLDDRMVDAPVVARARRILALAESLRHT